MSERTVVIDQSLPNLGISIVTLEWVENGKPLVNKLGFIKPPYFEPPELKQRIEESDAVNKEEALTQLASSHIGLATFNDLFEKVVVVSPYTK